MENRKIIMHIDMNSYFASVEQQANPFLRGKPVGVCAYLSPGGCIIASSVEAKAKGIKTGFRVRDAKQLCPEIFLIENEPAKYRSTTEKIFRILEDYTDLIEHYSIDEAFMDLTGWANERIVRIRHPEIGDSRKSKACPERSRRVASRKSEAEKNCHSRPAKESGINFDGNPGNVDEIRKYPSCSKMNGCSFKDLLAADPLWIPDRAGNDKNIRSDDFCWAKERIDCFAGARNDKEGCHDSKGDRDDDYYSNKPTSPSTCAKASADKQPSPSEGEGDVCGDFYWAKVIGLIVRERIKREVGEWMNCSIGISYTKFLAKFASDIAPKRGVLVIR